jgi:hypothetical protein
MPPPAWTRGLMGREPLSFELSIGPWVRVAYTFAAEEGVGPFGWSHPTTLPAPLRRLVTTPTALSALEQSLP